MPRPNSHHRPPLAHGTCVSCHKLPKFCACAPDAPPICKFCKGDKREGLHIDLAAIERGVMKCEDL